MPLVDVPAAMLPWTSIVTIAIVSWFDGDTPSGVRSRIADTREEDDERVRLMVANSCVSSSSASLVYGPHDFDGFGETFCLMFGWQSFVCQSRQMDSEDGVLRFEAVKPIDKAKAVAEEQRNRWAVSGMNMDGHKRKEKAGRTSPRKHRTVQIISMFLTLISDEHGVLRVVHDGSRDADRVLHVAQRSDRADIHRHAVDDQSIKCRLAQLVRGATITCTQAQ